MNVVAIVDYDMGNLDSVARAVEECGGSPIVTSTQRDLAAANRIILPGVGSFGDAMRSLHERNLVAILSELVLERRVPFLGICLGMQLLATVGWEGGKTSGLGWVDGEVERLTPTAEDWRIPHIGWNEVRLAGETPLFKGLNSGRDFYFVHSYHLRLLNSNEAVGWTMYAGGFVSAVQRNHIFGVQFHPEKSQRAGFQVLRNFLAF